MPAHPVPGSSCPCRSSLGLTPAALYLFGLSIPWTASAEKRDRFEHDHRGKEAHSLRSEEIGASLRRGYAMLRLSCEGGGWLWPGVCCQTGMSSIVYRVNGKSGDYIKTAVVPSNHSEEARFGVLDGVIVSFLLLCAGGLVCLLVLS